MNSLRTQSTLDPNKAHSSIEEIQMTDKIDKLKRFIQSYRPLSKLNMRKLVSEDNFRMKVYKQGDYYGQINGSQREGLGILIYYDSRVYEGRYHLDKKNGQGYLRYPNGSVYDGEFLNGQRHGRGRYIWSNGEIYDGEWNDGYKHGSGLWKSPKGDQYIGSWVKGMVHGYGVHVWINGDRYEGQFENCLKHGVGLEKFANGDVYEGEYRQGKPHGKGTYHWSNGNSYKGDFKDGVRDGVGLWLTPDGKEGYEGEYRLDKKEGKGTYFWSNGNRFEGEFSNDKRHGKGQMSLVDGTKINGSWVHGVMMQEKLQKSYDDTYRDRGTLNTISKQILKLKIGQQIRHTTDMSIKRPQPMSHGQELFEDSQLKENNHSREGSSHTMSRRNSFRTTRLMRKNQQFQSLDATTAPRYDKITKRTLPSVQQNSKQSEASTSIDATRITNITKTRQQAILTRLPFKVANRPSTITGNYQLSNKATNQRHGFPRNFTAQES